MNEIERRMAIWTKGKEYECQHNLNGDIIIYAKCRPDYYAALDENYNAEYYINNSEPVRTTNVERTPMEDLEYFVDLLIARED